MKIVDQSVEMIWMTENPEKMIELAARVCYKSEWRITEDSCKEFIPKLNRMGHGAMLEHASASFKIITDRGVSHEIVRHRIASYAQESTRYVNYSSEKCGSEIAVIRPEEFEPLSKKELSWRNACIYAERMYFDMLNHGCSPQIARSVLPTCTKTEIVMTANFREWIHFIKLRGSKAAHPQIRPIAKMIQEELKKYSSIFDFEV